MFGEWAEDSRILVSSEQFGTLENGKTVPGTYKNYLLSSINKTEDISNPYYLILESHGSGYGTILRSGVTGIFYWSNVINELLILKSASQTANYTAGDEDENVGSTYKVRIISDLASYFRENSYNKVRNNKTGLKEGKNIQFQNMIMYAVLVGQSLILFIAYIKRLFYVIMLAMIAPIVVVVDFFQKFGK